MINSIFRLIYVEMFGALIYSFTAVEVLAFYLVRAGKCSWDMKIFSCSALVKCQVSSYPGRGGQELNRKYRSKDSKLYMYLLMTSWFRALFSSIVLLKGPGENLYYLSAYPLEPFHIYWHYHDRCKFCLKKKIVLQKIRHFWSCILG